MFHFPTACDSLLSILHSPFHFHLSYWKLHYSSSYLYYIITQITDVINIERVVGIVRVKNENKIVGTVFLFISTTDGKDFSQRKKQLMEKRYRTRCWLRVLVLKVVYVILEAKIGKKNTSLGCCGLNVLKRVGGRGGGLTNWHHMWFQHNNFLNLVFLSLPTCIIPNWNYMVTYCYCFVNWEIYWYILEPYGN